MIELSILAHPADLGFLETTVRHQLRQLTNCTIIDRRVLVLDLDEPVADSAERLVDLANRLLDEGAIDEWIPVDWSQEAVSECMSRWYGDATVAPRAARRRARYQYAYSLDQAQRDLVLHLDSDILLHGGNSWIEQSPRLLAEDDDAVIVVPMGGAPQARSALDWVRGRRWAKSQWPVGIQRSQGCTTRHVLIHRSRVAERLLPLPTPSSDDHFEASFANAMTLHDVWRITDVRTDEYAWHPHVHNAAHAHWLDDLVEAAESGRYPYRRWGRSWDLTTEGWKFLPWQLRLWPQRSLRMWRFRRSRTT